MDSSKTTKNAYSICVKNSFISIPASRFKILSIPHLYKSIEHHILNDLHQFDLLEDISFKKHDVKKIFYHHIVKSIINSILQSSDLSKIICTYSSDDMKTSKVIKYSSAFQFTAFIDTIVRKISNLLPVTIYKDTYDSIVRSLSSTGMRREILNTLSELYNKINKQSFIFNKVKNFVKNYELTYLDRSLFGELKSKNLLI